MFRKIIKLAVLQNFRNISNSILIIFFLFCLFIYLFIFWLCFLCDILGVVGGGGGGPEINQYLPQLASENAEKCRKMPFQAIIHSQNQKFSLAPPLGHIQHLHKVSPKSLKLSRCSPHKDRDIVDKLLG